MPAYSSLDDVFRFNQLRPARPLGEVECAVLLGTTTLAKALAAGSPRERQKIAAKALQDRKVTIGDFQAAPMTGELVDIVADHRGGDGITVADAVSTVRSRLDKREFRKLSDTLLAEAFSPTDILRRDFVLREAFLIFDLMLKSIPATLLLADLLSRSVLIPEEILRGNPSKPTPVSAGHGTHVSVPDSASEKQMNLVQALEALERWDHVRFLVPIGPKGRLSNQLTPFSLNATAKSSLSATTKKLLNTINPAWGSTPIHTLIDHVRRELDEMPVRIDRPAVRTDPLPPSTSEASNSLISTSKARVRPVGIAELLVVKQHSKAYEPTDIAHIENVLGGEQRSRVHRNLERVEETTIFEQETTREQENELETTERFELNRETERTLKEDRRVGFDLSVSGNYGPSVEFSSNAEMELTRASEESTRQAAKFAKDVVDRSLTRVAERVREERIRRVTREIEETNRHSLTNPDATPRSSVYQFVDKVMEAQVFNYGFREMFEFMIPEPASFVWYLSSDPEADLELPPPPEKLDAYVRDASDVTEWNYAYLAAKFGASDIVGPPPLYKIVTKSAKHGTDGASESGRPRSTEQLEATLEDGYTLWRATVSALALSDDNPVMGVSIGSRNLLWEPESSNRVVLDDNELAYAPQLFADFSADPFESTPDSKVSINIVAYETATYTVSVTLLCKRTSDSLSAWKMSTYSKLRDAYEERVRAYEVFVSELRAKAEAQQRNELEFGASPSHKREFVQTELRKHCLILLTQQSDLFDYVDATKEGSPPSFDPGEAVKEGAIVRFFEQAFEWNQMQYVFYPYYWARKETWRDRFLKQDVDPQYREFLRAGSARAVVPVRRGFEEALEYFVTTGQLWTGSKEPPRIGDPLHVSIVDEIRNRSDAPGDEVPVGSPWEVRLPTTLVIARDGTSLPAWQRADGAGWEWAPSAS